MSKTWKKKFHLVKENQSCAGNCMRRYPILINYQSNYCNFIAQRKWKILFLFSLFVCLFCFVFFSIDQGLCWESWPEDNLLSWPEPTYRGTLHPISFSKLAGGNSNEGRAVRLFGVAYPSVGITLSVNHIYTFVSFRFLLSTTCYNAVKSLILRKKGKRNSVGKWLQLLRKLQ